VVIKVEDWAEIRRLHRAEGMPIKAIARRLGVARNTVRRALAAAEPPRYQRAVKGSIVDAVEPQVRALLAEFPGMPATVIAERIGWERSMTVLKERVRLIRPEYTPADPASRTTYQSGELAQCDWLVRANQRPLRPRRTGWICTKSWLAQRRYMDDAWVSGAGA
jgi:transposase